MRKEIFVLSLLSVFNLSATELLNIKGREFTREVKVWNKICIQKIKLSDFRIGKSKVTVKEYKLFLSSRNEKKSRNYYKWLSFRNTR